MEMLSELVHTTSVAVKLIVASETSSHVFGVKSRSIHLHGTDASSVQKYCDLCDFLSERSLARNEGITFTMAKDLNLRGKQSQFSAVSTNGDYVVDFKVTPYKMRDLDQRANKGVTIEQWKIANANIACGFRGIRDDEYAKEHAFKYAWFVYCDGEDDVYLMTLKTFNDLLIFFASNDTNYPRIRQITYDHDKEVCWSIPSLYWNHLGNLQAHGEDRFNPRYVRCKPMG